jgi:hypothetical protein
MDEADSPFRRVPSPVQQRREIPRKHRPSSRQGSAGLPPLGLPTCLPLSVCFCSVHSDCLGLVASLKGVARYGHHGNRPGMLPLESLDLITCVGISRPCRQVEPLPLSDWVSASGDGRLSHSPIESATSSLRIVHGSCLLFTDRRGGSFPPQDGGRNSVRAALGVSQRIC